AKLPAGGDGEFQTLKNPSGSISYASFDKDGQAILVCSQDGTLAWWHAASLMEDRKLPPSPQKGLHSADLAADGKTLFVVTGNLSGGEVELVDASSGERTRLDEIKNPFPPPRACVSADGRVAAVLVNDRSVWIYD